jgi:hypothetical protein
VRKEDEAMRVLLLVVGLLLLAAGVARAQDAGDAGDGTAPAVIEPIEATPGWWRVTFHGDHHWNVQLSDGCPDIQEGPALVVNAEDLGLPWIVLPDQGERCRVTAYVEAQ